MTGDKTNGAPALTAEQQAIVQHQAGHARVSAVAGSGKTTTMVARIGHLLDRGVAPETILVLMFNRSARDGFADAVRQLLGQSRSARVPVRTFHSLGYRLVQSFERRGALSPCRLVGEEYLAEKLARQVANQAWREESAENGWLASEEVEAFLLFVDLVKAAADPPEKVLGEAGLADKYTWFVTAYQLFERVRKEQRLRFYNDLIGDPLTCLKSDESLRGWVENRVDHIIVDEYQDINEAQQQLLKFIAGSRAEVMVVGDVDQCIYEWRGAKPSYITERFARDFAAPVNYQLSYTFRYGHSLSLAANHLISQNQLRDRKLCISYATNPSSRLSLRCENEKIHPVISVLDEWRSRGRTLREAVVLVRLYAMSVSVEFALLSAGIACRVEGGEHVFACREILALIGYLHLAAGSLASVSREQRTTLVEGMLSQPHLGLDGERQQRLVAAVAADPVGAEKIFLQLGYGDLPLFLKARAERTAASWQQLRALSPTRPAAEVLQEIVDLLELYTFYRSFAGNAATAENRVKTCQAFIDFARTSGASVSCFLQELDTYRQLSDSVRQEQLLITSIHRAKGLEWPLVILPGLAEGGFPFSRESGEPQEGWEDERRLCYVAMTRAREWLVCIHPPDEQLATAVSALGGTPKRNGKKGASRFLFEANFGLSRQLGEVIDSQQTKTVRGAGPFVIAERYCQLVDKPISLLADRQKAATPGPGELPNHILQIDDMREGMQVVHPSLGRGKIVAIQDRRQGRLLVRFEGDTIDTLLLAGYARLALG